MYLSTLTSFVVCFISSLVFFSIQIAFSYPLGILPTKELGIDNNGLRALESAIDPNSNRNLESALDLFTDNNANRQLESARDALITGEILTRSTESAIDPLKERFEDSTERNVETALSQQETQQQRNQAVENQIEASPAIALLDPPTRNCDAGKYDVALHTIKGKGDLGKILKNLDGKDIEVELISDLQNEDTNIVLLDTVNVLKGKMIINPTKPDPKEFDYNIKQIRTQCLTNTAVEEILQLKSNIKNPLVITDLGSGLLKGPTSSGTNTEATVEGGDNAGGDNVKGAGQIFQRCPGSDFATYSIIANGGALKSGYGKNNVDITIKILVDLDRNPIASTNAVAVIDDNKILAMTLVAEEGKHNEKILDFVPIRINTVCNDISYLLTPINIGEKEERIEPFYGFTKAKG